MENHMPFKIYVGIFSYNKCLTLQMYIMLSILEEKEEQTVFFDQQFIPTSKSDANFCKVRDF